MNRWVFILIFTITLGSLPGVDCAAQSPTPAAPETISPKELAKWPEKPVQIVSWGGPGSGTDIVARKFGEMLSKGIRQPVVNLNKTGGGGTSSLAYLFGQPPDGYAILLITDTLNFRLAMKMHNYDPAILARINNTYFIVATAPGSKYKTLKDIVDEAKKNPGLITFGGGHLYSTSHLGLWGMLKALNLPWGSITYVPFDSNAKSNLAAMGGHVALTYTFTDYPEVKAGTLRGIALATPKRLSSYPDIPTFTELGYPFVFDMARGFAVHPGTPPALIDKMTDAVVKAAQDPSWLKWTADRHLDPTVSTVEYRDYMKKHLAGLKEFLKDIGYKRQ